jgi:uncharacterized delta-60 repeat protein
MKKNFSLFKRVSRSAFVVLGLFVFFGTLNSAHAAELANAPVLVSAEQSDGKIIIGGEFTSYNEEDVSGFARLNADGSLDSSFQVLPGSQYCNSGCSISAVNASAVQSDGKIIIGGSFNTMHNANIMGIARLNSDGSIDTGFNVIGTSGEEGGGENIYGGTNGNITDIIIQPSDNKIIIGGQFTQYNGVTVNGLVRLNSDGSIDTNFTLEGSFAYSGIEDLFLQNDGKLLVGMAGSYMGYNYIVRLNGDGSLDAGFYTEAGPNADVYAIAQQSDNKVIIGGLFWRYGNWGESVDLNGIARLNVDSTLDEPFSTYEIPDVESGGFMTVGRGGFARNYPNSWPGSPYDIALQSNGKIIVGGDFYEHDGESRNGITRINADGAIDATFSVGSGFGGGQGLYASARTISILSNGKIFVGGNFTNYDGATSNYVALLNADGSLDSSFGESEPLGDIIIHNPTPAQMNSHVSEGYISFEGDAITSLGSTTTNVNVTYRTKDVDALFPTGTVVTEASSNAYNFENFTIQNITNTTKSEQPASRVAFRLGIEGTNLTFSQPITITTFIGEAFNNQTLDILYQNEGETTWNTQGTCTVENGQCTFTTDHATIYTINGTLQSTGDAPMNINTEVVDTLTLDCYDTTNGSGNYDVLLGTVSNPGYVTAGTPVVGTSTCDVTTNDDQGYYLTVEDDNGISSTVLTHTDPNTGTLYEIQDLTHWNDTTLTTENWNPPTTKGLGFSVITFPDTDTANNIFDGVWTDTGNCPEGTTPDSNDYAGFPDTPETIAAVPQYTANHTTTNICYKVDVPTSQPSGIYTGSVTYTATSDASSYLN